MDLQLSRFGGVNLVTSGFFHQEPLFPQISGRQRFSSAKTLSAEMG